MWRNYLAAAIRSLFRDRAYAVINIFGLALGFTGVLLIALYVRDEYSFDRHYPDHDRTYRIWAEYLPPGRAPIRVAVTSVNVAGALELDFPEVEFATRLVPGGGTLRQGNNEVIPQYIHWADPDFFRMFPPKVLAGDPNAALARPDGLVLTRTMARRLFNREDVIGEAVTYNREQTLRVGAVIEDPPSNTHFLMDVVAAGLASFSVTTQHEQMAARSGPTAIQPENAYTYVRLRPGASADKLNAEMKRLTEKLFRAEMGGEPVHRQLRLRLIPLTDLHFLPRSIADMKPPSDPRTVHGLILIAVLILFVAASNFVSMMTARAARRAVEVGVRKAVGATRRQIVVQFLAECLFYSGLALAVALAAVWLMLPAYNAFLQREISFDFFTDPIAGGAVLACWLAVGLAAGAYPAAVLSMFRPVTVLKGTVSLPGGPGRLRQAMVVLQFGTLVALVIATITVHRQTRFAIEDQLRVPGDQLFFVQFGCVNGITGFRDIVAGLQGVRSASCASTSALAGGRFSIAVAAPDGTTVELRAAPVDASFFEVLGITPLAGRLLDGERGEDNVLVPTPGNQPVVARSGSVLPNPSLVLNESGARALGYATPDQAVDQYRRWQRMTFTANTFKMLDESASRIVGVVPDISIGSIRERIEPMAYYIDPPMTRALLIKLDGATIPETMRTIEAEWKKATDGRPFGGEFMSQMINELYSDIRRQSSLFTAFTVVAVVVASLGLLGLAVFTAERRTREIGVRKAMGASRTDILRFLGWQFAKPVLIANLIAWPAAWFFMRRWLDGFAYHVDLGPMAFVGASALALIIALATVAGHALLVSRARPVEALRYE